MTRTFRYRRPARSGTTLLEMVVSLISAGILLAGMGSTLYVTLRATDTDTTPTTATIASSDALGELLADLEFAQSFSEQSATTIAFTVPDRGGDSLPETIVYAWSGTPGDPLTRQFNGGSASTFLENVHVFQHNLPVSNPTLLMNSDMEAGTSNWDALPGASISVESSQRFTGAVALLVQNSATTSSGFRQDVTNTISSGNTYRLRAWTKQADLDDANVSLSLVVTSSVEGVQVYSEAETNTPGESWTRVSATVTPYWTGTLLSAYWQLDESTGTCSFYVDAADLQQVTSDVHQSVNISLQIGSDSRSLMQSGAPLLNAPL